MYRVSICPNDNISSFDISVKDIFKKFFFSVSCNYVSINNIVGFGSFGGLRCIRYGNNYGWGIAHRKKNKVKCNVFVEDGAFTVMMRLSNKQYETIYEQLKKYTQEHIDNKYSCGDGGWIHYRVTCQQNFEDIKKLLAIKCS